MRTALFIALIGTGCATVPAGESEPPIVDPGHAGYRIWHSAGTWRLRAAAGGARHRFQGSVDGLTGGITSVRPDRPTLAEHVALSRNTILFDFESESDPGDPGAGFDAQVTGGCLRFDLFVDGKRRPDRVRFGSTGAVPSRLPATSCP